MSMLSMPRRTGRELHRGGGASHDEDHTDHPSSMPPATTTNTDPMITTRSGSRIRGMKPRHEDHNTSYRPPLSSTSFCWCCMMNPSSSSSSSSSSSTTTATSKTKNTKLRIMIGCSIVALALFPFTMIELPQHHHRDLLAPRRRHQRRLWYDSAANNNGNNIENNAEGGDAMIRRLDEIIIENERKETLAKDSANITESSDYCYAFLIGGVNEHDLKYRGFLFNVLVATYILRKAGSTADVRLVIQISSQSNLAHDELPALDQRLLRQLGIKVQYLPKPQSPLQESFYSVVYEKFRILQWVQYRRVLFLDADVMPITNLDYLFALTEPSPAANPAASSSPLIKDNLIVATRGEPANAGFFLLKPGVGKYEQLQNIIETQHESARQLPYPHFDWANGWGVNFAESKDKWEAINREGQRWRFWAGHSDQGLLYYWTKYVEQSVTICIGKKIQNWRQATQQELIDSNILNAGDVSHNRTAIIMESEVEGMLDNYTPSSSTEGPLIRQDWQDFLSYVPYRDYVHFSGKDKPWIKPIPWRVGNFRNRDEATRHPALYWWHILYKLNKRYDIGLDLRTNMDVISQNEHVFGHISQSKESPLGMNAAYRDRVKVLFYNESQQQEGVENVTAFE